MRFWFLVFPLTVLLALPAWADPHDDLVKALRQTRVAFGSNVAFAAYLKQEEKLTSALDVAFYSQQKLSSRSLLSVRHVIRQMRTLEKAWIFRYTLGIKGIESQNDVSFYYADQEKVSQAFVGVDARIKLSEYLVAQDQEDGNGLYATYAFDRLLRVSLDSIIRNIDVCINRLTRSQSYRAGTKGLKVRTGGKAKALPVTGTLLFVGNR
ncbi:MAG: hypothetical protein H7Y37_17825 [Anaerolineae bacterium]|nr:hypothetical protein [Gloeobacterales cyanobacterium ES-bin-313]